MIQTAVTETNLSENTKSDHQGEIRKKEETELSRKWQSSLKVEDSNKKSNCQANRIFFLGEQRNLAELRIHNPFCFPSAITQGPGVPL